MKNYKLVVSGGTFDHFHNGHKVFLKTQLHMASKILLGITSDGYGKEKAFGVESYQTRFGSVIDFLKSENALDRVEFTPINDEYIPTIWKDRPIEAIFVTSDSLSGAEAINRKRLELSQKTLPIEVVPVVLAEDGGSLCATRIRKGEIDREGKSFIKPVWLEKSLKVPHSLREQLHKPLGTLFLDFATWIKNSQVDSKQLISVGDVVTAELLQRDIKPHLSIVDLFVNRKRKFYSLDEHKLFGDEQVQRVKNPAGYLTPTLFSTMIKVAQSSERTIVLVEGEEDLAVLPAVLAVPLGYVVIYGQPNKGIVVVPVTETVKKQIREIVEKCEILASPR